MENPFFLSILHKAVYKEKKNSTCAMEKRKKSLPLGHQTFLIHYELQSITKRRLLALHLPLHSIAPSFPPALHGEQRGESFSG